MADEPRTLVHPIVCRGVDITDEVGKMFVALAESATVHGLVDADVVEAFVSVAALTGWARDLDNIDTDPPGFPECSDEERGTARVRWLVERTHAIAEWISRTRATAQARVPVTRTYRTVWSEEDQEYVGLCAEFPSLSWLAKTEREALAGIADLVANVRNDMAKSDVTP